MILKRQCVLRKVRFTEKMLPSQEAEEKQAFLLIRRNAQVPQKLNFRTSVHAEMASKVTNLHPSLSGMGCLSLTLLSTCGERRGDLPQRD